MDARRRLAGSTFTIPTKSSSVGVPAFGIGQLNDVRDGLPDGLTRVGTGNPAGPDSGRNLDHRATVAPAKFSGG